MTSYKIIKNENLKKTRKNGSVVITSQSFTANFFDKSQKC